MYSQIKHYQRLPLGTSHPLPMPSAPWQDMSMDLVSGLPLVRGIDMVCIVVDRLTKEIVVFPTTSTVSAQQLATLFQD